MIEFVFVLVPWILGWGLLAGAAVGGVNRVTGWKLALGIGGSSIEVPDDPYVLMGFAGLGTLLLGYVRLTESSRFKAFLGRGPRAWVPAGIVLVVLLYGISELSNRLSYETRAEWAAATGRVAALREELAKSKHEELPSDLLYLAAWRGSFETLEVLLEAGADPDAPGPTGMVPMAYAAVLRGANSLEERQRFVARLIAAGADPRRKDNQGRDLAAWTKLYGRQAVLEGLPGYP